MSELNKVVVRFAAGEVVKGTTQDFYPNRPLFHLMPADGGPTREIKCRELKAVFFVKDFTGDARRQDLRGFLDAPGETPQGRKVAVLFRDKELLCGYSLGFSAERDGFFLFPADPGSNNMRVYVLRSATTQIKGGPAAEELARKTLEAAGKAA
jgi:hypothetical protein